MVDSLKELEEENGNLDADTVVLGSHGTVLGEEVNAADDDGGANANEQNVAIERPGTLGYRPLQKDLNHDKEELLPETELLQSDGSGRAEVPLPFNKPTEKQADAAPITIVEKQSVEFVTDCDAGHRPRKVALSGGEPLVTFAAKGEQIPPPIKQHPPESKMDLTANADMMGLPALSRSGNSKLSHTHGVNGRRTAMTPTDHRTGMDQSPPAIPTTSSISHPDGKLKTAASKGSEVAVMPGKVEQQTVVIPTFVAEAELVASPLFTQEDMGIPARSSDPKLQDTQTVNEHRKPTPSAPSNQPPTTTTTSSNSHTDVKHAKDPEQTSSPDASMFLRAKSFLKKKIV